jgi:predicted nuclease of predicted toxin-antitoxin system
MKIKLDENLPVQLQGLLSALHHDVHTVHGEQLVGRNDDIIFQAATAEGRLLMTQDLDFSDIRRFKPGTHPGIVLIRLNHPSRAKLLERMKQILSDEDLETWAGCFVVIGNARLRMIRP